MNKLTEKAQEAVVAVQPLAVRLLRGEFHDGDHIVVDVRDGQFDFHRQEPAAAAA